jgi:hypothetical protein
VFVQKKCIDSKTYLREAAWLKLVVRLPKEATFGGSNPGVAHTTPIEIELMIDGFGIQCNHVYVSNETNTVVAIWVNVLRSVHTLVYV